MFIEILAIKNWKLHLIIYWIRLNAVKYRLFIYPSNLYLILIHTTFIATIIYSVWHINAPHLHFVNIKILLLWQYLFVTECCRLTCTPSVKIILDEYSVFESHANAYSFLLVHKYEKFICTRPVVYLWFCATISESKDKHLSSLNYYLKVYFCEFYRKNLLIFPSQLSSFSLSLNTKQVIQ